VSTHCYATAASLPLSLAALTATHSPLHAGEEFSGVQISAPVALRTVTAWYKLSGKKGARSTKKVTGEIQLSFNVSKSGSDLLKPGPVNRLSLLYLSITVLAARGIRAGDTRYA